MVDSSRCCLPRGGFAKSIVCDCSNLPIFFVFRLRLGTRLAASATSLTENCTAFQQVCPGGLSFQELSSPVNRLSFTRPRPTLLFSRRFISFVKRILRKGV